MLSARPSSDREYLTSASREGLQLVAALGPAQVAYLAHTCGGLSLRAIARLEDCPASTILRRVRRMEERRDDPLFDAALDAAAATLSGSSDETPNTAVEDWPHMIAQLKTQNEDIDQKVAREARRILRRLCETGAFLAVSETMERAVVLRETAPDRHTRTAVVERDVAHQFALKDWITCTHAGKIARYAVSDTGRAALKRLLEEERQSRAPRGAYAEQTSPFRAQHQSFGERRVPGANGAGATRVRYNLAESPLTALGRKRDKTGSPYLTADLVEAGERLREDFEIAQMGPRVTQNWEAFLTPKDGPSNPANAGPAEGPQAARDRVAGAMKALGPGLSDVVFRVCCFLEGLEAAEKRLGWSARSGKVVLRIALQRLAMHYGIRPIAPAETPADAPVDA